MKFHKNRLPNYMKPIQEGIKQFQKFIAPVKILKLETVERCFEPVILKKCSKKIEVLIGGCFTSDPLPFATSKHNQFAQQ